MPAGLTHFGAGPARRSPADLLASRRRDTVADVEEAMREQSWSVTLQAAVLTSSMVFVALGVACGGDSKANNDEAMGSTTSGGGSGPSAANASGGGAADSTATTTTTTTTGGSSDLSGTWDLLIAQPDGDVSTSTVTLSPTRLAVDGELELLALIADEVIDIAFDGEALRATRMAVDLDLGVIPLPFGGSLRFTGVPDEGPACDYDLDTTSLSLVCTDDISTPGDLPELDEANLQAQRTEALSSEFGELGGRWSVTAEDVECLVVVEGNTIDVECSRGDSDASVTVTVGAERISGSTSEGVEFTAQRR